MKAVDGPPLDRLGDYRILREVGRGGMGVVYEAVQESLGRRVALKVLPARARLDPRQLERFQREARAAAKLHHTNIVPAFGVGESDGVRYYAMQFIDGHGLDVILDEIRRRRAGVGSSTASPLSVTVAHDLLAGGFAAPEESAAPRAATVSTAALEGSVGGYYRGVARVGLQAAEALAHAHRQGVLHRDVKPSNLLLDDQGTVWVTDFGLAKIDEHDDLTQTGEVVGTLRFLAPERLAGRTLPGGDVYGLGLTLYELLTLRPAYDDANPARLLERLAREEPPRPRRIDRHIPRDLETIVLKATARDPAQRYATAEAMADDLRLFLTDRPVRARRVSWLEHGWRWCRRNPAVASLSALVLLLVAAMTVGSAVAAVLFLGQRDEALSEKQRAEDYARAVEFSKTVFPEPRNMLGFRGKVGESFYFRIAGSRDGLVVGTDAYADGSSLASAAVHAGAVRDGEVGYVRVTVLPKQTVYAGTSRRGVTSQTVAQQGEGSSFRVEPVDDFGNVGTADVAPRPPDGPMLAPPDGTLTNFRGLHGQSFVFDLVGVDDVETVRGTDVYADASPLAAAAVHAGALRAGERGYVRVTLQPSAVLYAGTARNGVVSETAVAKEMSGYRVRRVDEWGEPTGAAVAERPADAPMLPPDGGRMSTLRRLNGDTFLVEVTTWPSQLGSVWGTDVYTDDSSVVGAAVHAGLLRQNQKAVVKVTLLPGRKGYEGSTRNDVESLPYPEFDGSYRLELAGQFGKPTDAGPEPERPVAEASMDPGNLVLLRGKNGQSFEFEVVGRGEQGNSPWGTDVYTDDSPLAVAAVHAGVLRVGEKGRVKVTILPGRDSYKGSTRNGITSADYASWGGSYRVEPTKR